MCVCVCVCVDLLLCSPFPATLFSLYSFVVRCGGGYLGARVPAGVCPRKIHTTPCTKQSSHTSKRFLYHG